MIFTQKDLESYNATTVCHICGGELDKDKDDLGDSKVRDHCHLSGKFRGAAHNKCNLSFRVPKFIPVVFHNLSGYDGHLFIKKLNSNNGENIKCIPKNEEQYISFSRE